MSSSLVFKPCEILATATDSGEKMARLLQKPWLAKPVFQYILAPFLYNREPKWLRGKRSSFLKMAGGNIQTEVMPALAGLIRTIVAGNRNCLAAAEKKTDLVWFTWPVPVGILEAFGVASFCPENFYTTAQSIGDHAGSLFCEIAESEGVSSDMCSVNRCMLGGFFRAQYPRPTLQVSASHPCDGNHAGNTVLSSFSQCPELVLTGSYSRSAASIRDWAMSLHEMIAFLETHLHRKLDWARLEEVARNINRTNRALNQVTEMHRRLPSPAVTWALALFWRAVGGASGTRSLADAAELLLAGTIAITERQERKKVGREKIRVILGDQANTWADPSYWMAREFGATVVADYIGSFCHPDIDLSSKESIIEGLARDRLLFSMTRQAHGTMDLWIDEMETVIQEYSGDCVIFNQHLGCKHNLALGRQLEALCRGAGVPALFIGCDIVDRRQMGEAEVRGKIRKFFQENGLSS